MSWVRVCYDTTAGYMSRRLVKSIHMEESSLGQGQPKDLKRDQQVI